MAAKPSEQPLFRSCSADGRTVMLSICADGTWIIRRDDELVDQGPGNQISIDAAVKRFRAMVKPPEAKK